LVRTNCSLIQTCLAVVDAQREYAMVDHDGDGLLNTQRHLRATPANRTDFTGQQKKEEDPSPLGELLVKAKGRGIFQKGSKGNPVPYHGYL